MANDSNAATAAMVPADPSTIRFWSDMADDCMVGAHILAGDRLTFQIATTRRLRDGVIVAAKVCGVEIVRRLRIDESGNRFLVSAPESGGAETITLGAEDAVTGVLESLLRIADS